MRVLGSYADRSKSPSGNGHINTELYNFSVDTYSETLDYVKKGINYETFWEMIFDN